MNKILLFLLFSFAVSVSKGQGIDNLWILGYDSLTSVQTGRTTLDFSGGFPLLSWSMRSMSFWESNALISSSQGELLFYTNGAYIANASNNIMLNGSGLNPSQYTSQNQDGLNIMQSDIIIPFPDDSMKYYLFHVTLDSATIIPVRLYYSVIDMTLDGGLGGVVSKNNVLLHSAFYFGGLTACKHANGRDWWLISHLNTSNCYVEYLITPNGISGPYYQCIGKYVDLSAGAGVSGLGQVVFSPNGNWFANYDSEGGLDLIQFDRCTGNFNNCIHVAIDDSAFTTGAAFSVNSKVLYLSSTKYIYQFDLTAPDIPSTQTTVAVYDGFYSHFPIFATTFFLAQLAPDGKIYINTGNGTEYLHVINYPDSVGLACNVCQHCVHLSTYNAETIPNYPNYFLGADTTSSLCDSLRLSVQQLSENLQPEINLFPNPVTQVLYASLNENFKLKNIKVWSILGQEMPVNYSFIKNGEYLEIKTTQLSQGVYFLELLSEKEKIVKRFMKE